MEIRQGRTQAAPALPGVRGEAETGKEEWRVGGVSETKVCPRCVSEKPVADFGYRKVDGKVYVAAYCRVCERERARHRYKENPERVREIQRQYAKRNPERIKERYRKWYSENKEWRRKYQVICYWKNPDKAREKRRAWFSGLPLGYVNQILGGGGKTRYPTELLEAKQMQMKINRFLKDM